MNLKVTLGDQLVGTLPLLPGEQTLFIFSDEYIKDPSRPVLSQYYRLANGELRQEIRPFRSKLPPWFSNLLPEGPLLDYIAKQAGTHPRREYHLLAFLGQDLPGAVRVVSDEASVAEAETESSPEPDRPDAPLRFSLAGVQIKFSAVMNKQGGLAIPAGGLGGDWIVKLPSSVHPAVPKTKRPC